MCLLTVLRFTVFITNITNINFVIVTDNHCDKHYKLKITTKVKLRTLILPFFARKNPELHQLFRRQNDGFSACSNVSNNPLAEI